MTKFNIARPEVAALHKVATGPQDPDAIRLNANEAPETHWFADDEQALNRYPEARPTVLRAELAKLYAVSEDNLLVTRGSSEAIDVVIRTFAAPTRIASFRCHLLSSCIHTSPESKALRALRSLCTMRPSLSIALAFCTPAKMTQR